MVERVTAAMRQAHLDRTFAPLAEWRLEFLARAAIASMREPTRAMVDAEQDCPRFDSPGSTNPDDVWRAMIDAALKC